MRITGNTRLKLESYAWPGGYPIVYVARDGWRNGETNNLEDWDRSENIACPKCAADVKQWPDMIVVARDIHYEGPPEQCEYCNALIESAYGDPEKEGEE